MNSKQFIEDAIRTESPQYHQQNPRITHAIYGLTKEANEMVDALSIATFYGKELDLVNLKEESGDILWYLAILFDEIGTDFETEMNRVIKKLKERYPEKFTADKALNRNLDNERTVLEKPE